MVGTGSLGRHHARILSRLPGVELVGVHDARPEAAEAVAGEHGTRAFPDLEPLAERVEAAVVAVPTSQHAAVGCRLLEMGCHVLVEKPIAASLADADRLLEAAARRGRVLAVGHVEYHNPAVQALLAGGSAPRFVEVQRLGVFHTRNLDVDVILDLMIHDLQVLHALDPSPVEEVRATGVSVLSPRIDIANVRLELGSGCVANLTASRVSAERVRKLRVFLPSAYLSLDYQKQEIKSYRLVEEKGEARIVRAEVEVRPAEPLRRELEAFVGACRGEPTPSVSGEEGRRALATALSIVEAVRGRVGRDVVEAGER
ncbi:MAG TPA: Gfo/Idh/MocA family oxidoreductase [Thermoanaerobaculia bacterium]|nr:Gfo/Idh/MocA family oxidoreductase [Thermoanaerobaculia bacterium]